MSRPNDRFWEYVENMDEMDGGNILYERQYNNFINHNQNLTSLVYSCNGTKKILLWNHLGHDKLIFVLSKIHQIISKTITRSSQY